MSKDRFFNWIAYTNERHPDVSEGRWRGMMLWLKTNHLNYWKTFKGV